MAPRFSRNVGLQVLGIWLIAAAIVHLVPALSGIWIILTVLQLVAGVMILMGR